MTGGSARRLGAAAGVFVCLVALPGQASADETQTLTVADVSVNESGTTLTFTVKLSAGPDSATFDYTTQDGTGPNGAKAGSDYTIKADTSVTVTGGGEVEIDVAINNDVLDEQDNESFTLSISDIVNAANTTATATGTIVDNDPEPSASIGNATVTEGNTGTVDATVTVTLSSASGKQVTVPYSTAPGTATAPADYEHNPGNLVFAPGETSKAIVVKVKGDTLFEPNETFSVVITDPTNGTLGNGIGQITITDDDSSPIPTVPNASVAEGHTATTNLTFDVTLSSPRPAVTFNYRTVAGTATGSDYTEVGGAPLAFPANSGTAPTTLQVTIAVKGDVLDELDESFTLQLLNSTTFALVASATGTITNDDNNSKLSISDASADEPSSGTATMKFTVSLAPASGRPVSVSWATAGGTAAVGGDYTAGSGVVSFAPGETSKDVSVSIVGDTVNEDNETVLVNLGGAAGATISDPGGQGTIIDKNAPPSLSIDDVLTREGEVATFTITLAGTTARTVSVTARTIDGTAKEGLDYNARRVVLTFSPGESSKTFIVVGLDDAAPEGVENFFVGLEDVANATVTKARGNATVDASDQVAGAPAPPTTKPPVAKPVAVLVPRMILGPRTVPVGANGVARMLVTCQKASPIACSGTVELERAAKPLLKLGKRIFTVKKGAKAYASIKLSARALKLLRKNGTLRAKVIVLVKTSAKSMKVSPGIVTLKSTKLKPKPKPKAPPPPKVVVDP